MRHPRRWSVQRVWRNIEADSAMEAISLAEAGSHDQVFAQRYSDLAQLLLGAEEIDVLVELIDQAIPAWPAQMHPGPGPMPTHLRRRFTLLNSLRTALREAGYTLDRQRPEEP